MLAGDVASPMDVPPFDRSLVDGFALRATDTEGAGPASPRRLTLNREILACGVAPTIVVPVHGMNWDTEASGFANVRRLADGEVLSLDGL